MGKGIIGEKLGMTQIFSGDKVIPVTVLKAGPCYVSQLKTEEKDGYSAVQMGYGDIKPQRVNLPTEGHFKKANCPPRRYLVEFPLNPSEYKSGQKIKAGDLFDEGEHVDVVGVSKSKGFGGVVKRWGFSGGPASHGSRSHRRPGSIGACATPSRVFKGQKMAGRMGGKRATSLNLEVVRVESQRDLLMVKGSVPGPKGSIVVIRDSVKSRHKSPESASR